MRCPACALKVVAPGSDLDVVADEIAYHALRCPAGVSSSQLTAMRLAAADEAGDRR